MGYLTQICESLQDNLLWANRTVCTMATLALLGTFVGCGPSREPSGDSSTAAEPSGEVAEALAAAGLSRSALVKGEAGYGRYCTICHRIEVPDEHPKPGSMLAPPAFAVADHYRQAIPDPVKRIAAIAAYVSAPGEHPTLMPGAVERFGRMPAMPLDSSELRPIAAFLALHDFSEPAWYREHFEAEHGPGAPAAEEQ